MPSVPFVLSRHAVPARLMTTALRVTSFGVMAGALILVLAARGEALPQAMAAASAITAGLAVGALYSPLLSGLLAARTAGGVLAPRKGRGASWSGGVIGAAACMLLAGGAAATLGHSGAWVALALGLALGLNLAYLPAKTACLVQGCCGAASEARWRWLSVLPGDLRGLELMLTLLVLLAMALAAPTPGLAAALGFAGHGLTRLVSMAGRGHGLSLARFRSDPGAELLPLVLLAAMSLMAG